MALIDSAVTIQGRLVTLRPVSREDYPALFRWRSSFETVHMLNFRRRIATFEEFVRELEGMLPASILLLVRRARTGDPIGYALGYNVNQWDAIYDYGARMYDAKIGRMLQPDAFFDPYNPQSLNRYSYVLNNPLRYTDPTGMYPADMLQPNGVACSGKKRGESATVATRA